MRNLFFFNVLFFFFLFLQCQQNASSRRDNHSVDVPNVSDSYDLIDSIFTNGDRLKVVVFNDKIVINTVKDKIEAKQIIDNLPFRYSLTKWEGIILKQENKNIIKDNFVFLTNSLAIMSIEDDLNKGVFLPIVKEQDIWYPLKENQAIFFFAIPHWPLFVNLMKKNLIVISSNFNGDAPRENVLRYVVVKGKALKLEKTSNLPGKFQYSRPEYYTEVFNIE